MINIKNKAPHILKASWKIWMWICTILFTGTLIAMMCIYLELDFGTHFFAIDSCLDRGGAWHEDASSCYFSEEERLQLDEKY